MSDPSRDRRLQEASDLSKQLFELQKLSREQREAFLHDRIVYTIDNLCSKDRNGGTRQVFTKDQVQVLKDIAYQIVYVQHMEYAEPRSLVAKIIAEYREKSIMARIGLWAGAITFIVGMVGGFLQIAEKGIPLVTGAPQSKAPIVTNTTSPSTQTPSAPR